MVGANVVVSAYDLKSRTLPNEEANSLMVRARSNPLTEKDAWQFSLQEQDEPRNFATLETVSYRNPRKLRPDLDSTSF